MAEGSEHSIPIACLLSPSEFHARREELWPVLIGQASEVSPLENGYELRFTASEDLLASLSRVVELERACCPFLTFGLSEDADARLVTLSVTGPPGTSEFLTALFTPAPPSTPQPADTDDER